MSAVTPSTIYHYLELHCVGRARAQTEQQLASIFQLRGVIIREMIHDLRLEGHLIASLSTGENRGYFIPLNRDEAVAGIAHLVHRLRSLASVFGCQVAAIDRAFGEPTLFDTPLPSLPAEADASRRRAISEVTA
jgi:hypothetical protein